MALDSDYISFSNISNYTYDYDYPFYYGDGEISSETKPASLLFSVVCKIVIFCISVPGNIFLLCVLLRERAWKTTSDILLLQLIMSHLCLTVTLPFGACNLLDYWIFGDWICEIMIATFFLGLHSYELILTAMILFSYVAVVHTSCLSAQDPPKICVLMISIFIWLACAAVSIWVVNAGVADVFDGAICFFALQTFTLLSLTCTQIGIFFLIPAIIFTFCCVRMWITIKKCRTNTHQQAFRLNLGMIAVFFLCLLPVNIILFIESLIMADVVEVTTELRSARYLFAEFILNTILYLCCCLNPLVHIFGTERFRRRLPVPCCKTSQRGDGSHDLTMAITPSRCL